MEEALPPYHGRNQKWQLTMKGAFCSLRYFRPYIAKTTISSHSIQAPSFNTITIEWSRGRYLASEVFEASKGLSKEFSEIAFPTPSLLFTWGGEGLYLSSLVAASDYAVGLASKCAQIKWRI